MDPRLTKNDGGADVQALAKTGIYKGSVSAAGALTNGASGFSCAAPSSSVFTITHNLGLTANAYVVTACITGATAGTLRISAKSANSFTVTTGDATDGSAADRAFDFTMIVGDGEQ